MKKIGAILLLMTTLIAAGQMQYVEFGDFSAGIVTSRIGKTAPNQAAIVKNLLFDGGELRAREGYHQMSDKLGTEGIDAIGIYRKGSTSFKLLAFAGRDIYIGNMNLTDTTWSDNKYTLSATETDTGYAPNASYFVNIGDTLKSWESYYISSIAFDSTGKTQVRYTVDYVLSDTAMRVTTALADVDTGWTYSLVTDIGNFKAGETFVDSFYFVTDLGKFYYNDSMVYGTYTPTVYKAVAASATAAAQWIPEATYTRYGVTYHTLRDAMAQISFKSAINMVIGDSAGMFSAAQYPDAYVKVSLRYQGGTLGIPAFVSHPIYASLKVHSIAAGKINTAGGCVYPKGTIFPHISVVSLQPTTTNSFTIYADSLIATKLPIATGYNDTAWYTIIVDDSCGTAWDSTKFMSGDWFVCRGTSMTDDAQSEYASVLGGYEDDSGRVYVTHRTMFYDKGIATTTQTNVPITFFRRVPVAPSEQAYNCAVFWNDRWCYVADTTRSQIDFSEPFLPNSTLGYLVQVNPDDGEKIVQLLPMYGNLIIFKQSSIWKLNGVPGVDAYASLDKIITGSSFIAPKSIVFRDGLVFGLGRDGVYVFDFNSMVKISSGISTFFTDSLNWNEADKAVGGFWDGHYWLSYPQRGSIKNNRTLVFNPENKAWATSTLTFSAVAHNTATEDSSLTYFGIPDSGMVYLYGADHDDNGVGFTAQLRTGWFDCGNRWFEKIVNRVGCVSHRRSASTATMSIYTDGGTTAAATRELTASTNYRDDDKLWFKQASLRGYEHQIDLTVTNADSLRIGGIGVEYQINSPDY